MKKTCIAICLLWAVATQLHAQTSLPTAWDFTNPSISNPPAGWLLGLGTNGNLTYANGTGGSTDVACRLDATGEFLTIQFAEKPGSLSYYLKGTGISPAPSFGGVFSIQESDNGSTWTDVRSLSTISGTFTRFEDNSLKSTSRYVRFFYTQKVSGSNVALDSVRLQAAPAGITPSLTLKQAGITLVPQSTFVVGTSTSVSFSIENKSTQQALSISGSTLTGTNAADFSVTGMPASVAASSSANFTLQFTPSANGSRKATLAINSNDPDQPAFTVNLYGIGGAFATEPVASPTQLTFSNIRAYTFNTSFQDASTVPENYLVLRKSNSPVTETPADGQTYLRGDYIGGAQVAYIGSATNFKPVHILASSEYHFAVFSFNGPAGFQNYLTSGALTGSVNTKGGDPGAYYTGINSNDPGFPGALHAKISPHDTVYYSNYAPTIINNIYTRDTTGGKKVVTCVYTGYNYVYDEPFLWYSGSNGAPLSREHTYAQSWMPTQNIPTWPRDAGNREFTEYNDLHHLFPSDQVNANVKRSNHPFGKVVTPAYTSPTGYGVLGTDANGQTVYEPRDSHKGDLARALFYMCVSYNGVNGKNWSLPANQDEEILKKWHFQDLPDAAEIARHEYVASLQKNRNPFIDSVNFACRINFKNMTYVSTIPANCGVVIPTLQISAPLGGEVWPQGTTHNITWNSANVDSIWIEYSTNNGTSYQTLAPSVAANAATYSWNVQISSDSVRIKLTDKKTGAFSTSAMFSTNNGSSVQPVLQAEEVSIYPNPSNGKVGVYFSAPAASYEITVMDIAGRCVWQSHAAAPSTILEIHQPGFYVIDCRIAGQPSGVRQKLVIR